MEKKTRIGGQGTTSVTPHQTDTADSNNVFLRFYQELAINPIYDVLFILGMLLFEVLVGQIVIRKVSYTEIDWEAYMQEVEMWWVDGEYDYRNIRGGTGPLVYPAGFLYLFLALRWFTKKGTDIRTAQNIFHGFYLVLQLLVWFIFQQTIQFLRDKKKNRPTTQNLEFAHQIWLWRVAMGVTCLSKRIHSIFMLRLFNDGPTMLLLYLSTYLFNKNKWSIGCVVFSLAVSQKMNVLLFAPGLLLLLLQVGPDLKTVIVRLFGCCALPQLILGAPFLLTYPVSYLRKAFELDRVFFYKWTVNFKFLPEPLFVSKKLSILLLLCHLGGLAYFCVKWLQAFKRQNGKYVFLNKPLSAPYVTATMFVSNYVGICFARTLHYQFYCWYFHSLPYLLWYKSVDQDVAEESANNSQTSKQGEQPRINCYHPLLRIVFMLMIEFAFLTFPATPLSSAMLQVAHFAILFQIQPPLQSLAHEGPKSSSKQD